MIYGPLECLMKIGSRKSGNADYYQYFFDKSLPKEVRDLIIRLDADRHDMLHEARTMLSSLGFRPVDYVSKYSD